MSMTKAIMSLIIAPVSFLGMGPGALGQQEKATITVRKVPRGERPEFASAPGWEWMMRPQVLRIGHKFGQVSDTRILRGYSVVDAEGGALRIYFVQVERDAFKSVPPRLVILDAAGERYLPEMSDAGGFGNPTAQLQDAIFTLSPKTLAPSKAAYVGVERMTPQAR